GLIMLALVLAERADRWVPALGSALEPLERFGRNSLFVYWIHVELVYGYATWALRRHLSVPQLLVAWLAFSCLMYLAVVARGDVVRRARTLRQARAERRLAAQAAVFHQMT